MSILRVEQLEPRQLLSGACFAPESSSRPESDAGTRFTPVAERRSFVDSGADHSSSFAETWSRPTIVEHAGPQPPPLPTVFTARPPTGNEGAPRSGPAPLGGGPTTSDESEGSRRGPTTVVVARPSAATERPRETAATTLPTATAPATAQPGILLDLAGAAAVRLALPALVALAPAVPPVSLRDEIAVAPNTAPLPPSLRELSVSGSDAAQQQPLVRPEVPPSLSGVLSILPPIDLANLEGGLRQFVAQLESTGQALLRPVERAELWPWIVAAAAALAACEIARREFRSSEFKGPSIDFSDF